MKKKDKRRKEKVYTSIRNGQGYFPSNSTSELIGQFN